MKKALTYWYVVPVAVLLASTAYLYGVVHEQSTRDVGGGASIQYSDRFITFAEAEILKTYGDRVSVLAKNKTLRKFGRNTAVGATYETIWRTGGDETIPTSNIIQYVTSSDNGDTQTIVIEGHTINASNELTFVTQTATLTGQATTTLTTALRDVTRLYNSSTTAFAGTIYVYEDGPMEAGVPQTAADIHLSVVEGNQSEKAATAISNTDYIIVKGVQCFVFTKTAETVEFTLEYRRLTTDGPLAWRRIYNTVASNDSAYNEYFDPPFILPKNSDIRMRSKSDGTSVDVGCSFDGYLASVI